MADEKFYLRFENDLDPVNMDMGAEFIGWDKAKLMMKQRDGGFGRDESFDASEAEYAPERGHHFQKLQQAFDQHGFEMKVKQGVISEDRTIEYDLDGGGIETNEVDYLRSPLIQGGKLQLLKDRMETKINVFSDTTLDGQPIDPLVPENILYYAYPLTEVSRWDCASGVFVMSGQGFYGAPSFFNKIKAVQEYEIQNTLTYLYDFLFPLENTLDYKALINGVLLDSNPDQFKIITMTDNGVLTATLNLNITCDYLGNLAGGADAPVQIQGFFVKGEGELFDNIGDPNKRFEFFNSGVLGPQPGPSPDATTYNFTGQVVVNIGVVNRNENVWFYFRHGSQSYNVGVKTTFTKGELIMRSETTTYNVVIPMVRLYDVIKYWVKSVCGKDISAPRFASGGEFYSLRIYNGKLARLKKNEPFYITGKQIMDSIGNHFLADYESYWGDFLLYFGLFEDYYADTEIGYFNSSQFFDFSTTINPRFAVNDVRVKFSKYESQRENTQQNTIDEVHGEFEGLMPNKKAKNTYERTIEWVMSAPYQGRANRLAITETSNTATSDDDTIFAVDVNDAAVQNTNALPFTETSFLQHSYDPDLGNLSLRNDGSFSWLGIGMTINQPFVITTNPGQPNQGIYNVLSVTNSEIILFPISANPTSGNDGERNTRYTYLVDASNLGGVTWTDEGLTVNGLANSDKYPNLRYSLGQSIDKYHKKYLATMAYYHPNDYLRTTFYKNNPNAEINGLREGGQIRPGYPEGALDLPDPILTPVLYKNLTFVGNEITLATWDRLVEQIRTVRGFIRFIDNKGIVRKVYPKLGGWSVKDESIIFDEAEEKFEPYIINIWKDDQGFVRINADDYHITQLKYDPQVLEYRIMDRENQLLYNPIFWNRIYVNGNKPQSQNQLEEWLMSL